MKFIIDESHHTESDRDHFLLAIFHILSGTKACPAVCVETCMCKAFCKLNPVCTRGHNISPAFHFGVLLGEDDRISTWCSPAINAHGLTVDMRCLFFSSTPFLSHFILSFPLSHSHPSLSPLQFSPHHDERPVCQLCHSEGYWLCRTKPTEDTNIHDPSPLGPHPQIHVCKTHCYQGWEAYHTVWCCRDLWWLALTVGSPVRLLYMYKPLYFDIYHQCSFLHVMYYQHLVTLKQKLLILNFAITIEFCDH